MLDNPGGTREGGRMTAYRQLMDFRADLERRACVLREREQELTTELAGMELIEVLEIKL